MLKKCSGGKTRHRRNHSVKTLIDQSREHLKDLFKPFSTNYGLKKY